MWTRRDFLIRGTAVAASWPAVSAAPISFGERPDRILVVLQLTGGNDGLNTLIPVDQDAWYEARPVLSGAARGAHALEAGFALHPSLAQLANRFREGTFSAIHSVGYEHPDRSHFYSMGVWHTGRVPAEYGTDRPDTHEASGWLGRAAEQLELAARPAPIALHVGDGEPPFSLRSPKSPPSSLADEDDLRIQRREGAASRVASAQWKDDQEDRPDLSYLKRAARDASDLSSRLEESARDPVRADWPSGSLSRRLQLIARWIIGGLGTSVYSVELGGFDTHLDQAPTHSNLLSVLDGSIHAFLTELERAGLSDRVCVLAFSEFGRRIRENASAGTDHGSAGPVFLAGGALRGGIFGEPPDLSRPVDGDVPFTTDLRSVQATLERDWLAIEPASTSRRLPLFQRS